MSGYGSQGLERQTTEESYQDHSGREVTPELLELLKGQELYTAWLFTDKYGAMEAGPTADLDAASIVTSRRRVPPLRDEFFTTEEHYLLVDIDMEAHLVPSSTPGHSHLYIKKPLSVDQLSKVLVVLAEVGILEWGYVNACLSRGWTTLRLPWVRKGDVPVEAGGGS